MRCAWFFIFWSTVLTSALALADVSARLLPHNRCLQAVLSAHQFPPRWLDTTGGLNGHANPFPVETHHTVEVRHFPEDKSIWRLIVTRLPGEPWLSLYGESDEAFQGDPRFPLIMFGQTLGQFLGFDMADENTILIPNVRWLNGRIRQLNTMLPFEKKIAVQFYEQKSHESNLAFFNKFNRRGLIPIAIDNPLLGVHDISLHVSMILAPPNLMKPIFIFTDFFSQVYKNTPDEHKNEVLKEITARTDYFLASVYLLGDKRLDQTDYLEFLSGWGVDVILAAQHLTRFLNKSRAERLSSKLIAALKSNPRLKSDALYLDLMNRRAQLTTLVQSLGFKSERSPLTIAN